MREDTTVENELGPLKPGDRFGDCTVERLLGQGSMASVFLVRASDGAQYALKVMNPELAKNDPTYRERFLREAEFAPEEDATSEGMVQDLIPDPEKASPDGESLMLETQDKEVQEFLANLRRTRMRKRLVLWGRCRLSDRSFGCVALAFPGVKRSGTGKVVR